MQEGKGNESNGVGNTDKVDLGQFVCANAEREGGRERQGNPSTCPTVISRFDALHSMSTAGGGLTYGHDILAISSLIHLCIKLTILMDQYHESFGFGLL